LFFLAPKLGILYIFYVRIIAKGTLSDFWRLKKNEESEQTLKAWYQEAKRANWNSPNDIKIQYKNASILKNSRVVFNIAGNKYRLVVRINYYFKIVYIRFINTHEEYDKIDAETI
jgi:mRNA interferase HigB